MGNAPSLIRPLLAAIVLAAGLAAPLAARPAAAAEQTCAAAIQGKVAWNRADDRNWEPGNLRRLCESTTLVDATIECFRSEIQSHDDWDRAIRSCTEARHEVEVIYVIPNGQHARPEAVKALEAIMAVIQRHYFLQLGVTFKLKTPLVSVVSIKEGVDELKGDAMSARTQKFAENAFKRDYKYKENVIIAVYEGLDIGLGLGGYNMVSIPGDFWSPAYDMFKQSPSDLPKTSLLHGWSHELGHAFGLEHTEDARKCFTKYGIDIGKLPSLIMQQRELRPTVYDYPFIPQEKRLLLDQSYYPACRPVLGDRPHASWHLRNPLPPENRSPVPVIAVKAGINGRNVKVVHHVAGTFRMTGAGLWAEEDNKGVAKFRFNEEKRDDASVVLFDPERNFRLRLDLKQQQIMMAVGTSQFSFLYAITDASAAESGPGRTAP
jgi:hypothetical protein